MLLPKFWCNNHTVKNVITGVLELLLLSYCQELLHSMKKITLHFSNKLKPVNMILRLKHGKVSQKKQRTLLAKFWWLIQRLDLTVNKCSITHGWLLILAQVKNFLLPKQHFLSMFQLEKINPKDSKTITMMVRMMTCERYKY